MTQSPRDLLHEVVPHKFFFQIRWEDIDPDWEIGAVCLVCGHAGAFDMPRREIEALTWSSQLRHLRRTLRCSRCGNITGNTITVVGRLRHWRVLPSGRRLHCFPASTIRAARLSLGARIGMIVPGYGG